LCWVNLATYQDTSPYLLPLTFASHYTLIPLNPEEPFEFTTKIKILKDKNYPFDEHLSQANQWTEEEIKDRGKSMAYKAYHEIWRL